MKLFIIYNSDGDTTVREIEKHEFLNRLNGDEYSSALFLNEIPDEIDTNYWPENAHLIIEGNIVCPKPKEKITVYEL